MHELLGVHMNALTMSDLHGVIAQSIQSAQCSIIANHNFHSVYLYHQNCQMKAFYEKAHYIHIDGMALVFLGRLLGLPFRREHRVTYVDWVLPLMREAVKNGWRIFYLGSKPGIAEQGARILRERVPELQIAVAHGYFDTHPESEENRAVLASVAAYQPHILMVGMGMPRQEQWILHNLDKIYANAILTAGACMDYVAGAVSTPPRWAGKLGLEWAFRLLVEPRRLWRRYLIEPWFLLRLFVAQSVSRRCSTE
jgi:N-acetylglucosaminyldiphosphoundecaprenol N-acetyl-beta-D-mannosaminyltransferase